ncbi:Uncharacterized protein APZ42_011175 [Daphnia magna]|uniref:Uncharacterized protein n=1 Tax=Daphnia magna TaxID=35525 RepID=A0A162T2N7_9CRUS|nr:Uncharacterized protein APZ42_011175 [Daphnia magna]
MSDPELISVDLCAGESTSLDVIEVVVPTNIQNDKERDGRNKVSISGCGTNAKQNYKQTSVQNFFKVPVSTSLPVAVALPVEVSLPVAVPLPVAVLPIPTCTSPSSRTTEEICATSIVVTNPDFASPDSTEPSKKKKPYYRQKFVDKWLAEEEFKPWLEKRLSPSKNCLTAYCKFCCVECTNGRSELVRHMATRIHLHQGNTWALKLVEQQRSTMQRFVSGSTKQAELEGRLTLFIADNHLALSVIDSLSDLLKKCFPDDERVRKLALKKQKLGNIVRYGFGDHLKKDLVNTLKEVFFSIIIDETTDVSVKGQLACVVQYWCLDKHMLVVKLLDLIEVESATADGLSTSVLKLLERENIPLERVIGFSADTCSTMFGRHHSVSTLLTSALPNLLTVKCSCHSMNLSTSYACKRLPVDIEDGLRGVFNHFSHSTARRRNFSAFQEFVGVAKNRILSPGQTRWLSLEACVWRVKDQLPALKEYFESEYQESNTQTNKAVIASLKHPLTVPFLLFVGHALSQMNEVNAQFQSESPQLHLLKGAIEGLMQSFATNFMNPRYVISREVAKIDVWLTSEYVSLRKVYLGK